MSVNKVILIGNLGKDPEIRVLEGGTKVASFSLATTESYKNKNGERVDHTEWHNIVLWRGLAEIAEKYLRKGNSVYIEGRIRTRAWDDKDNIKRYTTEILADNLKMLGGKREENDHSAPRPEQNNTNNSPNTSINIENNEDDDLPF